MKPSVAPTKNVVGPGDEVDGVAHELGHQNARDGEQVGLTALALALSQ